MARPTVVAGNWKMHGSRDTAQALARAVVQGVGDATDPEVLLCPPFVHLLDVLGETADSPVQVGAQNVCDQPEGAFTGEVSVAMLAELGCSHVIIGHSERRHVYGESDELIERKFALLHQSAQQGDPDSPRAILCVGETLEEREAGRTLDVIHRQLQPARSFPDAFPRALIAYEPVWAIGTGVAATPDMAQEVHAAIRAHLGTGARNRRAGHGRAVRWQRQGGQRVGIVLHAGYRRRPGRRCFPEGRRIPVHLSGRAKIGACTPSFLSPRSCCR